MLVLDTAPLLEERMKKYSLDEVMDHARQLDVRFFYCGPYRCIAPPEVTMKAKSIEPRFARKGVA